MTTTLPAGLFRKKPVVVQAIQYPCAHPALRRCSCDANSACFSCGREFIMTLEGQMNVSPGDWIITGVQGEHYPCKPDIFAATYEPADTPPASAQDAPITVSLDPDPRGVSVGVWQGSSCIYNGAHAIPGSAPDAPLASMARAIFGDQIGGQMDAMAVAPSLSGLHGFAPGACDGMKSEDYVNKVRNGDWSSPDCSPATVAPGDAQDERPYCYALETRGRWGDESDVLLDVEYNATDSFSGGRTGGIPLYRRPAPAAGDALDAVRLPAKMPKHESDGADYPSADSYQEGYAEGWNDAIDAALAAQVPQQGEA